MEADGKSVDSFITSHVVFIIMQFADAAARDLLLATEEKKIDQSAVSDKLYSGQLVDNGKIPAKQQKSRTSLVMILNIETTLLFIKLYTRLTEESGS
jgi:hypothetical protein